MKSVLYTIIILITCSITTNSCKKVSPPASYPFAIVFDNLDSTKQLANARNKNIFLMVHADWCSVCNTFKSTVLQSTAVKNLLADSIVTALIDGDKTYGKPIANNYGVQGFPTFLILDKNGVLLQKKSGGISETEFSTWIKAYLK